MGFIWIHPNWDEPAEAASYIYILYHIMLSAVTILSSLIHIFLNCEWKWKRNGFHIHVYGIYIYGIAKKVWNTDTYHHWTIYIYTNIVWGRITLIIYVLSLIILYIRSMKPNLAIPWYILPIAAPLRSIASSRCACLDLSAPPLYTLVGSGRNHRVSRCFKCHISSNTIFYYTCCHKI